MISIQQYIYICKNTGEYNIQADSFVQAWTHLLTSVRWHEERETILKSLSYHTMLTTPQRSAHLVVQSQFLNPMFGTQLSSSMAETRPSGSNLKIPTSTVCLNSRESNCLPTWSKVNSQLTLFQNLQILSTIASGHDVIHTPASFPIWGLLWLVIVKSFARKCKTVPNICAPELSAE